MKTTTEKMADALRRSIAALDSVAAPGSLQDGALREALAALVAYDAERQDDDPSRMARALRAKGYAVVIFGPGEIGGFDPRDMQDRLVELGNEIIGESQA